MVAEVFRKGVNLALGLVTDTGLVGSSWEMVGQISVPLDWLNIFLVWGQVQINPSSTHMGKCLRVGYLSMKTDSIVPVGQTDPSRPTA